MASDSATSEKASAKDAPKNDPGYDFLRKFGKNVLEDKGPTDLVFMVEKVRVNAHLVIIQARAPKLLGQVDVKSLKQRKKQIVVELKHVTNTTVFNQLLKYLYEDFVDFDGLSLNHILDLDFAATNYEIPGLVQICEQTLFTFLTLDTVYGIMKGASEKSLTNVKDLCMDFALRNYKQFVQQANSIIKVLQVELFQEVVAKHVTLTEEFFSKPPLQPSPFHSTIVQEIKAMYNSKENADASISIKGEKISFHKAIVTINCPDFNNKIFGTADSADLPGDDKVSPGAFKTFLQFYYYGDPHFSPSHSCELLPFSHKYKLEDLKGVCEGIITKPKDILSVQTALEILYTTYLPYTLRDSRFVMVKTEATAFIIQHFTQVDFSSVMKMMPFGIDMATDILIAFQINLRNGGNPVAAVETPADAAPVPVSSSQSLNDTLSSEGKVSVEKQKSGIDIGSKREPHKHKSSSASSSSSSKTKEKK